MSYLGFVNIIISLISLLLTLLAGFLFRVYLKRKREYSLASAVNTGRKTKRIVKDFKLLENGGLSLERVILHIEKHSLLKKLESAETRGEMISVLRRSAGLGLAKNAGLVKIRAGKKMKQEILHRIIHEKIKKRHVDIFPRQMHISKMKDPIDLVGIVSRFDKEGVDSVLREYRKLKKIVREQLVPDKGIRKILDKSRTKEEVIDLGKQTVIAELHSRYRDLKARISSSRKKGGDVNMLDLRIMGVPAKIKMFELTSDREHVQKATAIMDKIESELRV